ncbi:MAG: 2Fe-2S iron-sulfur cluster binding domain-containing protein [Saprospiraceae bacterium]|nr:2Fe-2S iron-sulfur cluster binding domain-containing protein [Saprospiraceae bacterium]
MTQFILNDKMVQSSEPAGSTLLDFVRYHKRLVGTKIGCREGDCGACTLLVGEFINGAMRYRSLTSCITPLGNVHGKHVVTIEGLNMDRLSPVQKAMVDESGQQCGFCTVGFIVSMTGECLSDKSPSLERMISSIDGNICRCTGYKSIERAAALIASSLQQKDLSDPIAWLVHKGFLPTYFSSITERLTKISRPSIKKGLILGGGTDLLVQKHDEVYEASVGLMADQNGYHGIARGADHIVIGGATSTTSLLESSLMRDLFPKLYQHLKLVSSTPIRNIATVAGNFINASPIGDLTAFFIGINADLTLTHPDGRDRQMRLKDIFKGYKILDLEEDEFVSKISFDIPDANTYFNFEKVSKRRYLDIASVNSAISISVKGAYISNVHLSAGGVGPIPTYLAKTCRFLEGKPLNSETIQQASGIIESEIKPISDARGSKEYKSLLLRQLFFAHFVELFPERVKIMELV